MKSGIYKYMQTVLAVYLSTISFGCSSSSDTPSATTSVSGIVMAGPASGTSVTVKSISGTVVAGPVSTGTDGSYSIAIPNPSLSGDLIFEASGGTFSDEATATGGVSMGTLTSHASAGSLASGSNVAIDPSTTIIQKLIAGGKTKTAAENTFAAAFGYTQDNSIKPAFAGMSSASTTPQRLAGLRAAAFSQLTKDLGLTPAMQFELIQALADDLSDGVMDGLKTDGTAVTTASGTAIPVDISNAFAKALMTFQASSLNKSKLSTDKIDAPPFAKKALTANYIVEYVPGMIAAAQGKTSFKIKLGNRNYGSAATGKTITLMPKMYMPSMSHSAPVDAVVESSTPGTYDCSVYYLMASGPGMGIWELKVMIGMETATFYPPVAMAMGTTNRAALNGVSDVIGSMMGMGTSKRTYYLFNDSSTFGMSSTFKLFVAAADDSMMMKFPAVAVGSTLHNEMNVARTVSSMTVEASTDNGSTWSSLTSGATGHWSVSGLTGLASGGTVKVRVLIDGEQKTTDGTAAVARTNDFATFTVVAGM